jgi:hypothetical protein
MKNTTFSVLALFAFFLYGCKKDNFSLSNPTTSNSFFDSAVAYLKTHTLKTDFDKLDLNKSKILIHKNQNVAFQIFEKEENNKFLLIQKQPNASYSGNWVDVTRLNDKSIHCKSGIVLLASLNKDILTKLLVDSNEVIEMDKTDKSGKVSTTYFNKKALSSGVTIGSSTTLEESPVLPEVIIYYNVNENDGAYSWYWLFGQSYYSSFDYFDAVPYSGGGGYESNVVTAPTIISPDFPITDVRQELKCFTQNGASYNISVNVNQPNPGTRDVVNPASDFHVGHTYFTLEQHNNDRTSIIRNLGFYPKNSVKPGSDIDISQFGEDSNTPYDVSLTFSVTASEMTTLINTLIAQQAYKYNLNDFNCTSSALDALRSIGINLPSTNSTVPFFSGNDPGDLGEDIKALNVDNFSAQNGGRKITRTVSNADDQYPKGKAGTCQ